MTTTDECLTRLSTVLRLARKVQLTVSPSEWAWSAMEDIIDECRQPLLDAGCLEECGCCGGSHFSQFQGECRQDEERFP